MTFKRYKTLYRTPQHKQVRWIWFYKLGKFGKSLMISVLRLAQAAIVIFYTTWWTKVLPFAFISARTTRLSNNWWKWMAHCVQSEHLILEDDMSCNGKQHFSSVFPCNLQISKNNACLCCQTRESRTWMVMNRKDQERHVHTWFDQPMQDSSTQM